VAAVICGVEVPAGRPRPSVVVVAASFSEQVVVAALVSRQAGAVQISVQWLQSQVTQGRRHRSPRRRVNGVSNADELATPRP